MKTLNLGLVVMVITSVSLSGVYLLNTNATSYINGEICDCSSDNQIDMDAISTSSNMGLGCIPESIGYGEKIILSYPSTWDWRSQGVMTSVKNQGGCGSCVAFGTIGAFEAVIRINGGPAFDLSEADLFFCGCGECCNDGWYISQAVSRLYNHGVPYEACFPYMAYNMPCDPCDDREDIIEKPTGYGYLSDPSSIKSTINNYGPVITSFAVFEDFRSYTNGVYHYSNGKLEGYHCVAVVGYDDYDEYWICKNSWGSSWGESGYFRIGYGEVGICDSACYLKYEWIDPLVAYTNGPYYGKPNEAIQFYGSADGGSPPYTWQWMFGDGSSSNDQNPVHTYEDVGNYNVTLTVVDIKDESDKHITIAKISNPPDTPNKPSGPAFGWPKTTLKYSSITTDPDGDKVRYGWDWNGDSEVDEWTSLFYSGQALNTFHSFQLSRIYYVKVKAEDQNGIQSEFSPSLMVIISNTNHPPDLPNNPVPEDDSSDIPIDVDIGWTCSDLDLEIGDSLTYDVYFGTSYSPDLVAEQHSVNNFDPGILEYETVYYWKIEAMDTHGAYTEGPVWKFTTSANPNNAPSKPEINGRTSGKTGLTYLYTFVSSDSENDDIFYYIDWGDVTFEEWIGPYNSGEEKSISHTWTTEGTYTIKAKAKDTNGGESEWSDPLSVSMPKNKPYLNTPFLDFLEQYPILYQLLQQFLKL